MVHSGLLRRGRLNQGYGGVTWLRGWKTTAMEVEMVYILVSLVVSSGSRMKIRQ